MRKTSTTIYCRNLYCLIACKEYAENLGRHYAETIFSSISIEDNIKYSDYVEIEDTDIFDATVRGFRDGWMQTKNFTVNTITKTG